MNYSTEWQVYCPSTLLTSETEHHYAEDLVEHYEASLVNNEDAMCFMTNVLALAHQDVVSHFRIGFSDRTFPRKISLIEPPESEMARGVYQRLGLFKPNGHETFRGMIFVPEFDANHDFIGAFGQRIAPFPLKKRSATAYAVRAGVRGLFFNHQVLGTFDRIILCESPFDVISLHIVSVHNAVALLDYRYFDNAHLSELLDNGVTHVTVGFSRTPQGDRYYAHVKRLLEKVDIHVTKLDGVTGESINSAWAKSKIFERVMQQLDVNHAFVNTPYRSSCYPSLPH